MAPTDYYDDAPRVFGSGDSPQDTDKAPGQDGRGPKSARRRGGFFGPQEGGSRAGGSEDGADAGRAGADGGDGREIDEGLMERRLAAMEAHMEMRWREDQAELEANGQATGAGAAATVAGDVGSVAGAGAVGAVGAGTAVPGAAGAAAASGAVPAAGGLGPQGERAYELGELTVQMPELREERDPRGGRKAKRDLTPKVRPAFSKDGEEVELHEGVDYLVAIYEGDDVNAPLKGDERVEKLTYAGKYRAVITGVSDRLRGQRAVVFEVKKRKRSLKPLIALLLLLLAGVGVFLALYFTGNTPWYDPNAGQGIAGLHDEDLQAYIDMKVAEGMMNMTVLSAVVFENGTTNPNSPGEIGFNNLAGNHYDQKLTITLKDTGEVVYESGAISPGQNIQYITLNRELEPGIYDAAATVTGYDSETHSDQGSLAADIKIAVMD